MNKLFVWTCVALLVIISAFAVWAHFITKPTPAPIVTIQPSITTTASPSPLLQGITITSPQPNQATASPLQISGQIIGNGWTGYEGQAGNVTLMGEDGKELAKAPLIAASDWTQLPVNFQTTLTFNAGTNKTGVLVLRNENPSGDPSRDKIFTVPVAFNNQ